ncbi:hypothetical protein CGRA01v4_02068 [Colletotrichum graminicola]|nr:hypothetical protein CGRA01v4_02068 [Colletotrichum graminicola]
MMNRLKYVSSTKAIKDNQGMRRVASGELRVASCRCTMRELRNYNSYKI